jgi:hypothetical protein
VSLIDGKRRNTGCESCCPKVTHMAFGSACIDGSPGHHRCVPPSPRTGSMWRYRLGSAYIGGQRTASSTRGWANRSSCYCPVVTSAQTADISPGQRLLTGLQEAAEMS